MSVIVNQGPAKTPNKSTLPVIAISCKSVVLSRNPSLTIYCIKTCALKTQCEKVKVKLSSCWTVQETFWKSLMRCSDVTVLTPRLHMCAVSFTHQQKKISRHLNQLNVWAYTNDRLGFIFSLIYES